MKKILIFVCLLLITGCGNLSNTPKKRVEELFNNYQTLDSTIIDQLNKQVDDLTDFSGPQKEMYKDIIKDQYKGLVYEIKEEETNGDKSVVKAEIIVKDYSKVIKECDLYYNEHKSEFEGTNGNYSKFIDYKLDKLKNAKDKVTYSLDISLTQKDKKWNVNSLSETDFKKINGTYQY